jgi:hypothetical protein
MTPSIRNLTIHDISAQARAAADLGIPHDEANHFDKHSEHESHLYAAFKGAYQAHSKANQAVAA